VCLVRLSFTEVDFFYSAGEATPLGNLELFNKN
jgi:hypothetical protein